MCGRFTIATDKRALEERFAFKAPDLQFAPSFNVAPTHEVLTVTGNGENHAQYMRWGLIPGWAKDPSIGNRMINARSETVADNPVFRSAFRKRRCLVVADGYYEWWTVGSRRQPMRIVLKSGEPFAFAGLWEVWRRPEGARVLSCTVITTGPNSLVEPIHNRMPVILSRDTESIWLDSAVQDPGLLTSLLVPPPDEAMEAYEVSPLVNSARNNVAECIAPLNSAERDQLAFL